MMYSLDEIGLLPAITTNIKHRGDINPYVKSTLSNVYTRDKDIPQKLPIFVAPMTCLISNKNIETIHKSKVEPILPVTSDSFWNRSSLSSNSFWNGWRAVTLQEFKHLFNACNAPEHDEPKYHILIDVANGHMEETLKCVYDAKQEYGNNLTVMIGNIANPLTYKECCKHLVDYVRVGIGGGSGCTTSVQTGIHASLPYLLEQIQYLKGCGSRYTKVVADGGIDTIAKAIKCLALGADYVMMGKAFAQCEDTALFMRCTYFSKSNEVKKEAYYYGQSSAQGQKDRFGEIKSNPEGTELWVPVTTTLTEFTDKFEAALRSAMSYCNAHTLNEFIGKVMYEVMSQQEFNSFNK